MTKQPKQFLTRVLIAAVLGAVGPPARGWAPPRSPVPRAVPKASGRAPAVVLPVRMEPQSPLIVQYRRGELYRREVRLIPRPGSGMKIRGVTSDSPLVKAKLDPPAPSDRRGAYRLHLVIGPRRQAGDFVARVRLDTTDPRFPHVLLVVVGLAQAGPAVSPIEIDVVPVARGAKGKELGRMQVFNRGGPIRLLGIDAGNPGLRAKIVPKNPGRFYEVILRYAGGWKPGRVTSTIRVRTDDRRDPVLTVPFRAYVR